MTESHKLGNCEFIDGSSEIYQFLIRFDSVTENEITTKKFDEIIGLRLCQKTSQNESDRTSHASDSFLCDLVLHTLNLILTELKVTAKFRQLAAKLSNCFLFFVE
jgi:hypothetical protein